VDRAGLFTSRRGTGEGSPRGNTIVKDYVGHHARAKDMELNLCNLRIGHLRAARRAGDFEFSTRSYAHDVPETPTDGRAVFLTAEGAFLQEPGQQKSVSPVSLVSFERVSLDIKLPIRSGLFKCIRTRRAQPSQHACRTAVALVFSHDDA
jgi:hypothetical protein